MIAVSSNLVMRSGRATTQMAAHTSLMEGSRHENGIWGKGLRCILEFQA